MDNSKYEAVRAKVIASCPGLVEKTRGYLVHITNGDIEGYIFAFQKDELRKMHNESCIKGDSCEACEFSENEFETISNPIHLSHVLRAIKERLSNGNRFWLFDADKDTLSHVVDTWQLAKDDLSLQSPDTIDFLFKILCE